MSVGYQNGFGFDEQNGDTYFDYDKQAWVVDGVYQRCGHPEATACRCFGRLHAGEQATRTEACH